MDGERAALELNGTKSTDSFLQAFTEMYQEHVEFREGLLVALMRAFVSKANGHRNPEFPLCSMNFYVALEATSRKAFSLVSANMLGPSLRAVQRRNAMNKQEVFIICDEANVQARLAAALEKYNDPLKKMIISLGFDGTKAPRTLSVSTRHKAILGGAAPNHMISLDRLTEEEVKAKLSPKSDIIKADEMKLTVVTLQNPGRGKPPFFVLVGQPQTINESSNFNDQVMKACVILSYTDKRLDVISVAAGGVGYDNS